MPAQDSRAYALFEEIALPSNQTAFLHKMVTDQRQETEYLDFKGAGRIAEKDIRESWSQTISAFANTEGGVLIWGIRASRNKATNLDSACSLDLVADPAALEQRLKDWLLEATVEHIVGIRFAHYTAQPGPGGFVVCFVPEGKHKPYRAEFDTRKQYYQRVGGNNVIIHHSFLRSLFYPQLKAEFDIGLSIDLTDTPPGKTTVKLIATIDNVGTATAREPFVVLRCQPAISPSCSPFWSQVPSFVKGKALACSISLHPGVAIEFFDAGIVVDRIDFKPVIEELNVEFDVYAIDQAPQAAKLSFARKEILERATKHVLTETPA